MNWIKDILMMKKVVLLLMVITLLLPGCNSGWSGETGIPAETIQSSQPSEIINVSTSHFDSYTNEQSDTTYTIKGTVSQENDGNAILVYIRSDKNITINIKGTMERVSGGDTQLVYVAPDGTQTKIADNSIQTIDSTINVLAGEGTVKFIGESAVYNFDVKFGMADGVSYSDL